SLACILFFIWENRKPWPSPHQSPPSPEALEDGDDDNDGKAIAPPEDTSPTAPVDNNAPVPTQSEDDDKAKSDSPTMSLTRTQ
ncbi:unnamed protein product, partial [Cylindrotheca closterium]